MQREGSQAPIKVIELAGPPGAGKTSLLPTVLRVCEAVGLRPYTVEQAARVFASRTVAGSVAGHLRPPLRRKALWAIFSLGRFVGAVRLACRRPAMALHVARSQWRRPADADVAARRVVHWYVRMAGAYEFLRRRGRAGEALVIDEGFVHRVVQLHASTVERPERRHIARYVGSVPPSDLVVVVHAPDRVCEQRVRARGVWQRLQHRDGDDIDRFVSNAHAAIGLAADALRERAQPMVEIDNTDDLACAEVTLKTRLEAALSSTGPEGEGRWTSPRLRLPRVAPVVDAMIARRRPPVIAHQTCTDILTHYGLALTRPPDNIPFGRRNHNVAVMTSAGRKVLRRYRGITERTSVAHEHAVLIELERRGFPAVRLQRTTTADTVVADNGHLYALFDFEHGDNLTSYIVPRTQRARILDIAGRTLARLHRELADFVPAAEHHLEHDAASGDLDWYLEALAELPAHDPAAGSAGRQQHRELATRSRELASWLTRLHEHLTQASLPQVMIHGDYGLHNLLFRGDGVAVVGDFELARREWRLIDLIIVLSRIPFDRGRAFVGGYRREAAIADGEWRHLSDVWQYYRLTGAVRSWHNHFAYGGEQGEGERQRAGGRGPKGEGERQRAGGRRSGRLAAAGARVAEAEWARAQVASRWL